MQDQDTAEAVGKENQVERPPWSRDSPGSHVRRGPRQRPQEDLHTSTSLSQEKFFLGVWLESKDRWDGGTWQLRELWENTQGGRNSMATGSEEWRG